MKKIFYIISISFLLVTIYACASGVKNTTNSTGSRGLAVEELQHSEEDFMVFPQLGHGGTINSLVINPAGTQIASGKQNIILWDIVTGRQIRTITHNGTVNSLAYSPDGKRIVSASSDKTVKLWDVASGKEIRTFLGHIDSVKTVAFSPDGTMIASGSLSRSGNNKIILWDTANGQEILTIDRLLDYIEFLAFSPDGKKIVANVYNTITLWDISTGQVHKEIAGRMPRFSPDGNRLIYFTSLSITIWDIVNDQFVRFPNPKEGTGFLEWSPAGDRFAVGIRKSFPEYSIIKLYDSNSGREIKTIETNTVLTVPMVFCPNGRQILTGGGTNSDSTIKLFDIESGRDIHTFLTQSDISMAKFSPNGEQIITAYCIEKRLGSSGDAISYLYLWDVSTGHLLRTFSGNHTGSIHRINFKNDGTQVVSVGFGSSTDPSLNFGDNLVKLWDVATGIELLTLQHSGSVWDAAISHDGKQIATCGYNNDGYTGFLKLWDIYSKQEVYSRNLTNGMTSLTFSPDGKMLVSGNDRNAILWDAEKGEIVHTFEYDTELSIPVIMFNNNGTQVVVAGYNNIELYDTKRGRLLHTFEGRSPVAFSPDDKQLLTNSLSQIKKINIWDIESGQLTDEVIGTAIDFCSNFEQFASRVSGGVAICDTSTGQELAQFISFSGNDSQLAAASRGLMIEETVTTTSTIEGEWISITPDGYYQASPRGDRYLNVRINNNVTGIEDYRHVFRNPDVVRARLQGLPDPDSKSNYTIQQADKIAPPNVTIQSPVNNSTTNSRTTNLSVSITSSSQPISNIIIQIEGRRVGQRELTAVSGENLRAERASLTVTGNQMNVNFSLLLELEPGLNNIEVIAFNGYTETRRSVNITAPAGQRQLNNLWIAAIGVNRYDNADTPRLGGMKNLNFAIADARALLNSIKTQEGIRYRKVNDLLITDGTTAEIKRGLDFLNQAGERDTVLLFIAGHGVTAKNGKFYFLPKDAVATIDDLKNWTVDENRAISVEDIYSVLDAPGNRLVFIDACQAGGVDNNELTYYLMNSNAFVFASSEGDYPSYESPGLGHGFLLTAF